ncbi:TlpA disulfide reductase family protein [Streptomyces sp. NPDC021562]|uniref:TlpA family protein disulfide reductase n=1 Tax=Streptomyces sp. NPDC021562 TaxID=3155121 RepID=UPI0010D358BE
MTVRRWLPLLVLLIAVPSAACSPPRESGASPVSPLIRVAAADRQTAPDLTGEDLDGRPVRLADYRGKVVVLNVWASWCSPCRAEAPELSQAQRELAAEGVQVLGVDMDARREKGRAFQEQHRLSYPSLHDPASRQLLRLPRGYKAQALPYTLFVDRDGKIAARYLSPLTAAGVRRVVGPLLAGRH